MTGNIDHKTVSDFGKEWSRFDQSELSPQELELQAGQYFKVFPWHSLPFDAVGFDLGCGSGRWSKYVSPRVGRLHCIDPSIEALNVARRNLKGNHNCDFHLASVDNIPLEDNSMDFGFSLGVLHHIPDTAKGIKSCVDKLKKGSPFLLYIYYAFDNRAAWFRFIWHISDWGRRFISKCPNGLKKWLCQMIAVLVYYPLARFLLIVSKFEVDVDSFPLSAYRYRSFYSMKTDALDRFGTRLEHRFTAAEIADMMSAAGLERIEFSDSVPYWCAVGYKRS